MVHCHVSEDVRDDRTENIIIPNQCDNDDNGEVWRWSDASKLRLFGGWKRFEDLEDNFNESCLK